VYYHITHHLWLLTGGSGGGRGESKLRLAAYLAPIVVGVLMILFMIKPLFARPAREPNPLKLEPNHEPRLFEFVRQLCDAVRAPVPREIRVDCDVNASASFRRGLWSMIVGRDLVLTIGMPLAAGLTLREFAGVLAHEFGHFSQGLGMRLSYIIRSVSLWFARVVYERDAWDEWLAEGSEDEENRLALVYLLTRACIWLSRRVLWVLMIIGHVISCYLLRQMEHDADRHEARVAGADAFESTMHKLGLLSAANAAAHVDLEASWRVHRLADNVPEMIVAHYDTLPDEARGEIRKRTSDERTGLLDTHPSAHDRIECVRRDDDGVFRGDGAASGLFSHFEATCKAVTQVYYHDQIGPAFQPQHLVPTRDVVGGRMKVRDQLRALERYFGPCVSARRPILFKHDRIRPPADANKTLATLKEARQRLAAGQARAAAAFEEFTAADRTRSAVDRAETLARAGILFDPDELGLERADDVTLEKLRRESGVRREAAEGVLARYDALLEARLYCGLQLLHAAALQRRVPDAAALLEDCNRLLGVLALLREPCTALPGVARDILLAGDVGARLETLSTPEAVNRALLVLRTIADRIRECLKDLRARLRDEAYPFDHGDGAVSIAGYAFNTDLAGSDPPAAIRASMHAVDRLGALYLRILGRLAEAAEQVEKTVHLPPGNG
jgi:Zn-dependent protease with chaperone function